MRERQEKDFVYSAFALSHPLFCESASLLYVLIKQDREKLKA
jgi:hypothetical protein